MKIGYADYEKYLEELAKYKKQDLTALKEKMKNCGAPGTRGTTVSAFFTLCWNNNTIQLHFQGCDIA